MDDSPAKRQKVGREWVKLQADNYEAIVSVSTVMSYPSSYLATRVQFELDQGSPDPAVRLDCDAEQASEIVAVLRQGPHYKPLRDNVRLVELLRHTLDFMGLPTPHFPCSSDSNMLLLPAYAPDAFDEQHGGLLLYSASSQGWATTRGTGPVPNHLWGYDYLWLAAVVPREYTTAGEDLVFMLPNDPGHCGCTKPVLLRASLKASVFEAPREHAYSHTSALAAANGKLYLLGRGTAGPYQEDAAMDNARPSTLEVFEPHTGAWFAASSPLPERSELVGHALLSNKAGGILLALGGELSGAGRLPADGDWDRNSMAKYDIKAGQ